MNLFSLASPKRFLAFKKKVLPWSFLGFGGFTLAGLYLSFFASPADYQQGETVRIMYVHVPASWMALGIYTFMALCSVSSYIWRHSLADLLAKCAAPLGLGFTAISLITGSLWGKPMWGTWWVWDARLTSVLGLLFLYLGYMALVQAWEDPHKGLSKGRVLLLVGFINIPIIKGSVDWWNTLHQPASLTKLAAPSIHISLLIPLFLMTFSFIFLFVALLLIRTEAELLRWKYRALEILKLQASSLPQQKAA